MSKLALAMSTIWNGKHKLFNLETYDQNETTTFCCVPELF
jgi:hypothetical protein